MANSKITKEMAKALTNKASTLSYVKSVKEARTSSK